MAKLRKHKTDDRKVRITAGAPEKAPLIKARIKSSEDEHAEDADDIRVIRERRHEPFLTQEEFFRKHGG